MNWFANLLVISGAGVAGYFAEPSLRLELTGIAPAPKSTPISPELLKIDLAAVDPAVLPKSLLLKKDTQVTDSSSGTKMTIRASSHVKLVRLENGMAIISPGADSIEGPVEPNDTDLREQLAPTLLPPTEATAAKEPGWEQSTPATEKPASAVAPGMVDPADPFAPIATPAATEAPAATPAAAADPNDPKADPFFAEAAGAAPATAAPAEPTAAFAPMPADDIVKVMQDSIKAAQIKEFKFDQVTEWTAGEPEKVSGTDFNTGLVSYQGKTFLGVKAIQAKAYISGGKVVRWIMPKSGKELE